MSEIKIMCECDADPNIMCFICSGKKPYIQVNGQWVIDHERMYNDLRDSFIQFIKLVAKMRRAQKEHADVEGQVVKEVDDLINVFVNPGGIDIKYIPRDEKIIAFLKEDHGSHFPKWCEAYACGCTGCVNKAGGARAWATKHPEESNINREEFDRIISKM